MPSEPETTNRLRCPSRIALVLVLAWVALIFSLFFVGQEKRTYFHGGLILLEHSLPMLVPTDGFVQLWLSRFADLSSVLLLVVSSWGIGLAGLRLFRHGARPDTLTHVAAVAAGMGAWGWLIWIAGLVGMISWGLYLGVALLSLCLLVWHWPMVGEAWRGLRVRPRVPWTGFEILLLVCLGLGTLLHFIPCFAPEVEYDSLEYHIGALKEYQKQGRIVFLEYNFYASMPSMAEMLYLWGIVLRSPVVAKLLHMSFAVLTAVGLYAFGAKQHSRRLGLVAASLYYLLPFVTSLGETSRIDLATTFFAFMAGAMLHRHLFDDDRGALRLAAWCVGLTMATKYTAAPVVFLPWLAVWLLECKKTWNDRLKTFHKPTRAIWFIPLLALVPVLPWLIKNWVFTGNPVYPLLNGIFDSPCWSAASDALFHSRHAPRFDSIDAWLSFFKLAWSQSTRESFSSPILFLFVPLFLLVSRPDPRWKFCLAYAAGIYVCWFLFTFRPWRFLFPALPWFALLGAFAMVTLEEARERTLTLLVRVALGAMLAFNLNFMFLLCAVDVSNAALIPPRISKFAVFAGRVTATRYLDNVYFTQMWMGNNLPPGAHVLFVGEARVFYAPYRVAANTVYDRSILGEMVARSNTPANLLDEMRRRGLTHIYINDDEMTRVGRNYDYLKEMNWPLFREFLAQHTKLFFKNNAHSVYEIVPNAANAS